MSHVMVLVAVVCTTSVTNGPRAGHFRGLGDATFENPSFAEQENGLLKPLKKGAAHMSPLTLLWLVREVLYQQAANKARDA